MRKRIIALLGAGAFAVAVVPVATASSQHETPGTPGDPNCEGQTRAALAQASKEKLEAAGLGNLAKAIGLSVPEVQAIVREFCAGP